jgi:hypothetical protein
MSLRTAPRAKKLKPREVMACFMRGESLGSRF